MRIAFIVTLLIVPLFSRAAEPDVPSWKAGVAAVVITPDVPMWMAGYASRDKPAEGKLHDLKAKGLAIEDLHGRRAVIVTIDLVGIDRGLSSAVCEELAKRHALPRDAILLSVSHTHSGPVAGMTLRPTYALDEANQRLIEHYTNVLKDRLVAVAGKAIESLAPADLAWGNGHAGFAVNRRENYETNVPQLREQGRLKGPFDHDVPVLSVRDKAGALQAVLFGYACHATVLSGYDWSGDYPGFAQIALEKAHPGAIAMFFAGCGADQNPLPRRTVALAEAYGNSLAESVDEVLGAPMTLIDGRLTTAYRETVIPFAAVPSREELNQTAAGSNRYEVGRAKLLLSQLDRDGAIRADYPYPVQAWRLDGLTLVALGGEVVVDYSLRLKRELGAETTWVAGYTNDVMAYIPTRRVLEEGGYEGGDSMVYFGLPSPWSPEIETRIVTAVHEQVQKVRTDAATVEDEKTSSR
ncbi:MAG: neutral/alkaline non-lysosomal ceramidase N-terminal domain-containing protein [Planctomycetaceae bacterium]